MATLTYPTKGYEVRDSLDTIRHKKPICSSSGETYPYEIKNSKGAEAPLRRGI